ncbi:LCP family protein [Caryophanon tenue]|uniref:Transcriptional regulator n=1 Tax=Caryophanon tenue TaxID=33978 RepID=A0A1C0YNB9_9BACL|nr:LCP family protein [Caryophanon tenue]OCS88653.1 transcriptional regulator [Caryophanon tenue]
MMHKQIRWRPVIVIFLTILIVVPLTWAVNQYITFQETLEKITKPIEHELELATANDDTTSNALLIDEQTDELRPFSVLLLGVDERDNDVGRSDTMIVLTVNPHVGTIKMLSIPRDTRTEIVGHGTVEKINHAYAHGGVSMALSTVEHFLQMPIDFYVKVNMEGFLTLIDTFGGVEVDNDLALTYRNYHFPKGHITLNGDEALVFSRIRYEDPRGDFGRQTRQRLLLQAVLAEAKNPATLITKLDNMFEVLGNNVHMNVTSKQLHELIMRYNDFNKQIEQIQLEKGHGQTIDELWYYIADDVEVMQVSRKLQQHLAETL